MLDPYRSTKVLINYRAHPTADLRATVEAKVTTTAELLVLLGYVVDSFRAVV